MKLIKESLGNKEALEELSDLEHDSWARWMKHLFKVSKKNEDGTVTIPKDKVNRWGRQMNADYDELTNKEKESDRKEVRKFMKVIKKTEEK